MENISNIFKSHPAVYSSWATSYTHMESYWSEWDSARIESNQRIRIITVYTSFYIMYFILPLIILHYLLSVNSMIGTM